MDYIHLTYHLLYFQCFNIQIQLPRNDDPNTVSLDLEIQSEVFVRNDLSNVLPVNLYLMTDDIQYACEYDPSIQLLSIFEHFLLRIFELEVKDIFALCLLPILHICIW